MEKNSDDPRVMHFTYTNHRGETRQRKVIFYSILYHTKPMPEYGYEPGLFLHGLDLEKDAYRTFDMSKILPPDGAQVAEISGATRVFDIQRAITASEQFWIKEASDWAKQYGALRQASEARERSWQLWAKKVKGWVSLAGLFNLVALALAFSFAFGLAKPFF